MNIDLMIEEMLDLGAVDWAGLWDLPWVTSSKGGATTPEEIKRVSLILLRELLERDLFEVGDVLPNEGFRRWNLGIDEALARISAEWPSSGVPSLGDVCWLNLTERGQVQANALRASREAQA